jgi:hypothetical protein
VVLFGGNGFPAATIIYNQNRPKSQHKTKKSRQNSVKIGNFGGKIMAVKAKWAGIFLLPYISTALISIQICPECLITDYEGLII